MPAIFDLLYREYCRARLAEMRKQLLIARESAEVPQANCDVADDTDPAGVGGADPQYEIGRGAPN
ncbi:hypothetical protein NLM33_19250 [Bradyrhizobium sp. CCGUVB1N3]|uniref:hypothetical protein n=1 Tax=Bradyrhizobium sp. CCGUVB1N3 TaxID=2949629 RepID=UPI0020B3EEFE|nr:hypothetical protein [Bradyrhizobium sp. CCGUVB1N3]MCP3472452.1 hypothetical protein [Bradyrhizobium sp. CCGUVB1N3]